MKERKPQSEGSGIAVDTHIGMALLYAGIAVFMSMLFLPQWTAHLSQSILDLLHIESARVSSEAISICSALGIHAPPRLAPPAMIAQFLWLVGAALLILQPLREKSWAFMVFEVSMVLASLLPLLDMSFASTVLLRSCFTLLVVLWLGSLEGMHLFRALLPWNWYKVWQRKLGDTALAVVGSELLCWGYSLVGLSPVTAWLCLVAGSIVMMRFGWAGKVSGVKIAVAWYNLNLVYVITGVIQLAWILYAAGH